MERHLTRAFSERGFVEHVTGPTEPGASRWIRKRGATAGAKGPFWEPEWVETNLSEGEADRTELKVTYGSFGMLRRLAWPILGLLCMTTLAWTSHVSRHAERLQAIARVEDITDWELAKSMLAAIGGIMGTLLFVFEVFPGGHLASKSQARFVLGLVDEAFTPCSRPFHYTGHTAAPFGIPFVRVTVVYAASVVLLVTAQQGSWGLAGIAGFVIACAGIGDYSANKAARAGSASSFAEVRGAAVIAGVLTYVPMAWGMVLPALIHVAVRETPGGPGNQVPESFAWLATLAVPVYVVVFLPLAWASIYDGWVRHRRLADRGEFQEHLGQQAPVGYKVIFWTFAIVTAAGLWIGVAGLALTTALSYGFIGPSGLLASFTDLPPSSVALMALFTLLFLAFRGISTASFLRELRKTRTRLENGEDVTDEFKDLIKLAMGKRSTHVRVAGGGSAATHTVSRGVLRLRYTVHLQRSLDSKSPRLRRSLVAHELGHCVLHYPRIQLARFVGSMAFGDPVLVAGLLDYALYEEQADAYAADLLSEHGDGAEQMIAALRDAERESLTSSAWIQAATPHLGYCADTQDFKDADPRLLKKTGSPAPLVEA